MTGNGVCALLNGGIGVRVGRDRHLRRRCGTRRREPQAGERGVDLGDRQRLALQRVGQHEIDRDADPVRVARGADHDRRGGSDLLPGGGDRQAGEIVGGGWRHEEEADVGRDRDRAVEHRVDGAGPDLAGGRLDVGRLQAATVVDRRVGEQSGGRFKVTFLGVSLPVGANVSVSPRLPVAPAVTAADELEEADGVIAADAADAERRRHVSGRPRRTASDVRIAQIAAKSSSAHLCIDRTRIIASPSSFGRPSFRICMCSRETLPAVSLTATLSRRCESW